MSEKSEQTGLKKIIMNKKIQELFWYLVFGVLTTLVNIVTFAVLDKALGSRLSWNKDFFNLFINLIAWVVAVVFAYVTNKLFVFHTKGNVMKEFIAFVAARIFTLVAFELGLFEVGLLIMEKGFNMPSEDLLFSVYKFNVTNKYIVKVFIMVVVTIANYVFSKLFIFKKKDGKKDEKKESDEPAEVLEEKEA